MGRKAVPRLREQLDPSGSTAVYHTFRVTLQEGSRTLHWVRVEQHAWSDWAQVQESSCTREGVECRVCAGWHRRGTSSGARRNATRPTASR